ncbi:hypothetical protein FACS189492_0360 [Clostridia bacterium]|nr:hypothetical protein FACS189492_0360 [Clostridia bacterium]
MSEELIQRNLIEAPEKMGVWNFYNIGSTTLKALKAAKIIPDRGYEEFEAKKPDALIVKKPRVVAAIEYKQPKELKTKKQIESAILQEIGTARVLGAKIYIVTDGKKTFWINTQTGNYIQSEDGSVISLQFSKDNIECVKLINKAVASISATNDKVLAAAVVDPLPLAQRVWQDLWSVSGATPENCLYTFVEIFIFKYLSDLGVLKGMYSFNDLLAKYANNTENEVIEFYASTVRVKIKELFPWNPKDKTTIINGTIFVSKDDKAVAGYATVFKKILNRFNEFGTLENIDYDFKSKLFETFLKESISKKNWGQFFTPLKVVRSIVSMADISAGMKICDPACGVGKFLLEPILHDLHKYFKVSDGKLEPQIILSGFDKGFDKDEQKTIILAKANMLIYLSGLIRENADLTKQFADLFNRTFFLQTNSILGTLANPVTEEYDLILTNPPYVMSGSSNLKDEISKQDELKQYFSISAMGIEGLFMEWIIRALKPGGKAFVVVPDGIMNRSNDKRLRDFILDECILDAIISLPLNTFFTTNKKTYIMALTKKTEKLLDGIPVKERQSTPVFTYLCSEIGESRDTYRFDIEQNDLDNATTLYNMFKGVRGALPTDDKRCKIVSIEDFYAGTHWSVERWWAKEERIELGIEDKSNAIDSEAFASLIGDLSNTLLEYQDLISSSQKKKADVNFTHFRIDDIFDIHSGNGKYTKTYAETHTGLYPLFSGNTKGAYGYIDSFDYDVPCVSYVNTGLAGYVMTHNSPFSANNHRSVLIPKKEGLNLNYLRCVLEPLLRNAKKGRLGDNNTNEYTTLTRSMLKEVELRLPVNDNGNFDVDYQGNIAEQFLLINELKSEIEKTISLIEDSALSMENDNYNFRFFVLSDVLKSIRGCAKYTRKYGDIHKGSYPVYSASANKPLTNIDSFDYDGTYLSWATNGFAGTTIVLDGKFSINGDRAILIPLNNLIDIRYLKYVLEPTFRTLAKGRLGDDGKDEFTKLYPSMIAEVKILFPVDDNGNVDSMAQKEIANQYAAIEQYKREIVSKLKLLLEQPIIYS